MKVQPKVKDIPSFLAGSRPSRLHKQRRRQRDDRRLRWLARSLADDAAEMFWMVGNG
jgi:hypothetical protein